MPPPTARLRDEFLACPECDLLHRRAAPAPAGGADAGHPRCTRCGAALGRAESGTPDTPLALALAGLVTLLIAHLNPILGIDLQGQVREASLWQAARALYDEGSGAIAALVVVTTLVNPALELLAVCGVLLPLRRGRPMRGAARLLRFLQAVRPWVMVEVFMLGVLVALVKLAALATIVPGTGLWAFAAAMLLLAATAWSFDHERVWVALQATAAARTPPPGAP